MEATTTVWGKETFALDPVRSCEKRRIHGILQYEGRRMDLSSGFPHEAVNKMRNTTFRDRKRLYIRVCEFPHTRGPRGTCSKDSSTITSRSLSRLWASITTCSSCAVTNNVERDRPLPPRHLPVHQTRDPKWDWATEKLACSVS